MMTRYFSRRGINVILGYARNNRQRCRRQFLPSATKLRRLCFYRCLSVHRGVGCLPQCMLGYHPPGADTPPPRADTPREQTLPHPGADTPPPRYGHCCGRYASYWNAFLFILYLFIDRSYCSMSVPNENADDVSYLFSSCVQKKRKKQRGSLGLDWLFEPKVFSQEII